MGKRKSSHSSRGTSAKRRSSLGKKQGSESKTSRPSRATPRAGRGSGQSLGYLFWIPVMLTVFVCLPDMMSGNYLPKSFWAALSVAAGLACLPPKRRAALSLTPLGALWLAYLSWAVLSLLWAQSPRVALERWLALLLPTLAYLLARRTRFWESRYFWMFFCGIIGTVSLIGCLQYAFSDFPLVHKFPGTAVPRATVGAANYASLYLMLTLPFVAWFYFRSRSWMAALAFVAMGLGFLFILLAKTRGAWVGLTLGALFLAVSGIVPKFKPCSRKFLFTLFLVCLSLVPALTIGRSKQASKYHRSMKGTLLDTAKNITDASARLKMWRDSMGIASPWVGAGFGSFPIVATPESLDKKVKTLNWEVHNDYLQAFFDLGVPGAALFSLAVILLIWLAWKGRKEGLILAAGASAVGLAFIQLTTFTSEKVSSLIWIAGVAAILNSQKFVRPVFKTTPPAWMPLAGNYAAVLYLGLFSAAVGYSIRGDREFRRTQAFIAKANSTPSHLRPSFDREARSKLAHLTGRVLPRMQFDANMVHISCHQLSGAAVALKAYESAEVLARKALALHPFDRTCLLHLFQIEIYNKQLDKAEEHLKRGIEIFGYDPDSPFVKNLAALYEYKKQFDKAKAVKEKTEPYRVSKPKAPSPPDRSSGVSPDVVLDWSDTGPSTLYYNLYLWKQGETIPKYPFLTRVEESKVRLERPLEAAAVYFWRVDSVGKYKAPKGDIWVFRTTHVP